MNNKLKSALLNAIFLALVSFNALSEEKPNIVFILSDDQAWTDYGFMGHSHIETPNLDQLANEGVVFDRGYVPTSLCRPSLMTIITGQYAHQHGVTGNDPSSKYAERGSELYKLRRSQLINKIDGLNPLPKIISDEGYISYQSGKWWEGNFRSGGFTQGMTRGFPARGGRHGDDGLEVGRQGLDTVKNFIDGALEQEKPFFVWYAPFLPHTPHNPPERLLKKYTDPRLSSSQSKYYAMVEWFDETIGDLIGYLSDKGVRDNTLIVYVTDNGWIQDPGSNGYAPRSKQTPYEGGVRTPIIFSWPKYLEPRRRSDLVSSVDILPTVVSAAGGKIPAGLPGLDLMPVMREQKEIQRKLIFGEGFAHDIADIDDPEASLLYRWVIENEWKLILSYDGEVHRYKETHKRSQKGPQLYHLSDDPHEKVNVALKNPEIVKRLSKAISDWYPVTKRKLLKESHVIKDIEI